MINSLSLTLPAVIVMAAGVALGFVADALQQSEPRYLALDSLTYEDGAFTQTHLASVDGLQADWTAEIKRNAVGVCPTGHGRGSYNNLEPETWPIDLWVGADVLGYSCEDRLTDGTSYTGYATWEYLTDDNTRVTVQGRVDFVYSAPEGGR